MTTNMVGALVPGERDDGPDLAFAIRDAIREGRLSPDEPLASVEQWMTESRLPRQSVETALLGLTIAGFVETRVHDGKQERFVVAEQTVFGGGEATGTAGCSH